MQTTIKDSIKVLPALQNLYPDSSRRTLQNWIKAGRFTVDGKPIKHENEILSPGSILSSKVTFKPQLIPGLRVLYEDRYLVAIDKPEGLLSVALDNDAETPHLLALLKFHYKTDQIFAVHRIDRDTSGCIIFAKGKESETRMKNLFEKHDLNREYMAIVEGRVNQKQGTWTSHLIELENYDVVESEEGKEAITHFTVLRHSPKYTYLKLQLETGRKHQIRVHCKAAGHPVVGDKRYGSSENPAKRLCLHSLKLEFVHPFTKTKLSITSPFPHSLKKLGIHL